jgi:hypothetical protein
VRVPIWSSAILLVALALTCLAQGPSPGSGEGVEKKEGYRLLREAWRKIEPGLFLPGAPAKYDGLIECSGNAVSLREPLVLKTEKGTTVRLTRLQPADREFLRSFRKPPTRIYVMGPIIAVDAAARTITVKAVSTMFGP